MFNDLLAYLQEFSCAFACFTFSAVTPSKCQLQVCSQNLSLAALPLHCLSADCVLFSVYTLGFDSSFAISREHKELCTLDTG